MAWNEPGGNGKQRDPWGGDQGPPDLDEAFRKFREKLGGALGGGGTGDARFNSGVIGLVLLLIFGVWFYLGIYARWCCASAAITRRWIPASTGSRG